MDSMSREPLTYAAGAAAAGSRLDQFLVTQIGDVSRARVQQLITQGKVEVDGRPERASYRLRGNESIAILGAVQLPPLKAVAEDIPLDVVYEDDSLAVVNKPAGMMVHAGAGASADADDEAADPRSRGTLVNALLHRFRKLSKEGGELRPGIVHRLDKDTSGLIVVAKSDSAHRKLAEQFASRKVKKKYLALVHGWPKSPTGMIDAAIGRDRVRRSRMSVKSQEGRDAVSRYTLLREYTTPYGKFSMLEVTIETGRTHQIRVHLASIGMPVVGDSLYGAPHEIEAKDRSSARAQTADTKKTRDRATTDLARRLTEEFSSGKGKGRPAKTAKARAGPPRVLPAKLTLGRNFLHAAELEFDHPKSGKHLSFQQPIPGELSVFLEQLVHSS